MKHPDRAYVDVDYAVTITLPEGAQSPSEQQIRDAVYGGVDGVDSPDAVLVQCKAAGDARPDVVVICVRDPDYSNEFDVFADGVQVEIIDVDLGSRVFTERWEREEFRATREEEAGRLERAGHAAAAEHLRAIVKRTVGDGDSH